MSHETRPLADRGHAFPGELDRRLSKRSRCRVRCVIRIGGRPHVARIERFGAEGIFLRTSAPLALDDDVRVSLPDTPVTLRGRVRYLDPIPSSLDGHLLAGAGLHVPDMPLAFARRLSLAAVDRVS